MYAVSNMDYHFFAQDCAGSISAFHDFVYGSTSGRAGNSMAQMRWLNLGPLSFQPSEFAKVAVILFLAWQIDRSKKRTEGFWFMCRTMLSLLPIVGLVGSNNLSTAIIILGIGVILIFASNPKYMQFIGLGSAGIGFVTIFLAAESYRLERLAIWKNPEKYDERIPDDSGTVCDRKRREFLAGDLETVFQKLGFVSGSAE